MAYQSSPLILVSSPPVFLVPSARAHKRTLYDCARARARVRAQRARAHRRVSFGERPRSAPSDDDGLRRIGSGGGVRRNDVVSAEPGCGSDALSGGTLWPLSGETPRSRRSSSRRLRISSYSRRRLSSSRRR